MREIDKNNLPNIKVIKRADVPLHPDLARLAKSMATVLQRRYPNPFERKMVAVQIMSQVQKAA